MVHIMQWMDEVGPNIQGLNRTDGLLQTKYYTAQFAQIGDTRWSQIIATESYSNQEQLCIYSTLNWKLSST